MGGRLAGIARHGRPRGPMETLERAAVSAAKGVQGDYHAARAATRRSRRHQISLIGRGVGAGDGQGGAAAE